MNRYISRNNYQNEIMNQLTILQGGVMSFKKMFPIIIVSLIGFSFTSFGTEGLTEKNHDAHKHHAQQQDDKHQGHMMEKTHVEEDLAAISQKTCPVMGGEISKEYYYDHKGKRVYFCCENCIEEFKKEPEKYLKKLEELGEKVEHLEHND